MNALPRIAALREQDGMHFLKTLFWVLVAVVVILFASRNWAPVTLNLWGDIQADVKLPLLLIVVFLIAFLPTWLILRARIWTLKRRIEALDRSLSSTTAPEPHDNEEPAT